MRTHFSSACAGITNTIVVRLLCVCLLQDKKNAGGDLVRQMKDAIAGSRIRKNKSRRRYPGARERLETEAMSWLDAASPPDPPGSSAARARLASERNAKRCLREAAEVVPWRTGTVWSCATRESGKEDWWFAKPWWRPKAGWAKLNAM